MAADRLNEHLVLSEEPPAESSPAAVPRHVHRLQVQQPEQCHRPPLTADSPAALERTTLQVGRGRDGAGTYHAQITVNPAAAALSPSSAAAAGHWQAGSRSGGGGGGGGSDHRQRTSHHLQRGSASSGLRFNVVQQHHGRHNTSELVPVSEDDRGPPPLPTKTFNGTGAVNNNSNGRQAGHDGGDGNVPHRGGAGLHHFTGRQQEVADPIAGSMATVKSVDVGECGKNQSLFIIMYANENLEMVLNI